MPRIESLRRTRSLLPVSTSNTFAELRWAVLVLACFWRHSVPEVKLVHTVSSLSLLCGVVAIPDGTTLATTSQISVAWVVIERAAKVVPCSRRST